MTPFTTPPAHRCSHLLRTLCLRSPAMRINLLLPLLPALVLGCRASDSAQAKGDVGGTMIISTAADADFLLPPLIYSIQGAQVSDLLFERLATPGPELNTVG